MTANKLPALAAPRVKQPKAAREQLDIQPYEGGLLELARVHHPSVTWWHGYRKAEERFGSYCYICERFIVTWDRFLSIPQDAQQMIDNHKRSHRNGNLPAGPAMNRERVKK